MNSLRLATVQFTPSLKQRAENITSMKALTEGVSADIIVLPELCSTGYFFLSKEETTPLAEERDGETRQFLRQLAHKKNAIVVGGFIEKDGENIYNSAVAILPESGEEFVYRKTHLFYRERFCFNDGNTGFFCVRSKEKDITIGIMICYDWRFPEASRTLALKGADLIVCPSNLVTDVWHKVMPARAIENKVYFTVSNRAGTELRDVSEDTEEELLFKGRSAIYGYNGEPFCIAQPDGNEILYAEITPQKTRDKSFNPYNDVLKDRRPAFYT
jgi:predicted amidohydrolase